MVGLSTAPAHGQESEADDWVSRFVLVPPASATEGVCAPSGDGLPGFAVTPSASGRQLVRVSLPFAPGTFPAELGLAVETGGGETRSDVRPLTWHPGRPAFVRRAMITFVYDFPDTTRRTFRLALRNPNPDPGGSSSQPAWAERRRADSSPPIPYATRSQSLRMHVGETDLLVTERGVEISRQGETLWRAEFLAPGREWTVTPTAEVIEQGEHYLWVRLLVPDAQWPRILEVRADALGAVAVRGHLQRLRPAEGGRGRAPDIGWRIRGRHVESVQTAEGETPVADKPIEHAFVDGKAAWAPCSGDLVGFPDAHLHRRGQLAALNTADGSEITYWRCRSAEQVPHQLAAWRTATVVISPSSTSPWTALLEPPSRVEIASERYDAIYHSGLWPDLAPWRVLAGARKFHVDAMAGCTLLGDDFGNVTTMPKPAVFGMNRLNHCPAIFEEYYRSGEARLRTVALQWCENLHDLSIWWGTSKPGQFGGTRYNNMAAHHPEFHDDPTFMWRSETAVSFCTKGGDSFFYAYEETGDPRMATALRWQIDYASRSVHTDQGECRNIGDVTDFLRLHRFTGQHAYFDEALRLFRELRTKLSDGGLFSQGGKPIDKDPPFINDDAAGYKHPFAKPYIIGYALAGLPALARQVPDEPKLCDVVRAVADFMAESQDPLGGWRYPHPRSTGLSVGQSIEHAVQLSQAAAFLESRGEPIGHLVDAIERTLQARILAWAKTGQFFDGVQGWEAAAGLLKDGKTIYDLYKKPQDRDPGRDYTEGAISLGGAPPEAVVYFSEVLAFYLAHRPPERLLQPNGPLRTVLSRMAQSDHPMDEPASQPGTDYLRYGSADNLPTFRDALVGRLAFPLRYRPESGMDFGRWRVEARARLLECLLTPPPRADFQSVVIGREDRGSYEARKLVFSVSADCRIPAYLLVPKAKGPLPAVIALHDHGAHFSIGKEKVIRPFGERQDVLDDARKWVDTSYGGRFIGDELAQRGYVVFGMDALFWGDRGRKEGVDYAMQQALASNLLQMGMSWIGVITWDDIRSAEFVASLPEVDPQRIGAIGLSMGSHRTWMLCAATDRVSAGVAVCWLGTTESLMSPGNNQTKGHSAYSMLVPNLRNFLDYPDVAAIACPKPMLFYNGQQDTLFPVQGVNDAYATIRHVWDSQQASDKLVTRLWPAKHVFNVQMQEEAFTWLDRQLGPRR